MAHDAFVEAYLKLSQLRDPEKFAAWLKILALNLCRIWYRRRRWEAVAMVEEPAAAAAEEEWSVSARMFGGLSRLSPAHRLVLVLQYWEGLSYDEIARFLGVPAGTVMSRLHRARRELKRLMEAMEEDEEMAEVPDDGFKREVEVEIDVLLAIFGENADARERLSVILRRSPQRFAQLIAQAPDEKTLADLALLLPRPGRPAIDVALACCLSADAHRQGRATTLLRGFIAAGKPGPEGMARLDVYLLLDQLLQASAAPVVKAPLIDELLAACPEERTALLLANALLCFPEEALPLLLHRFWQASSPAELYGSGSPLYTLCRTGTRFAAALLEPLRDGEAHPQVLAFAGAEAVARSLRCDWLDPDTAPDERVALDARFRWKWAPPSRKDRDPGVIQALAASVAAFLNSATAALREAALHTLGLLKAEPYREPIEAAARHADPATRRAAVRALADLGDGRSAPLLMAVARDGGPGEQREAIRTLGRLRIAGAEPLLAGLLAHADREVGQAAALALGDIGGESARARLLDLLSQPGPLRREAARALHGGVSHSRPCPAERETERPPAQLGRMTEIVRGGARPPFYIALDAAIRTLPALQAYDEATLSRHISQVCTDWAGTRRRLVEERLMRREAGIYRFTALGEAVWRVERFMRERG